MDAPQVQYVKTSDGYDIAYAVSGEGIPVIRVPQGFSHFSLQWSSGILDAEFRQWSEHFKMVLFDSRGQGLSTRGLDESTALTDYERDIDAIVSKLGLERFILLGISSKGKVAVRYAIEHPEQVLALVLWSYIDPFFQSPSVKSQRDVARTDWDLHMRIVTRMAWGEHDPSVVESVNRQAITQSDFLRANAALAAESGDIALADLQVPTLLLAPRGFNRPVTAEDQARRAAPIIPNARLVLFDDARGGLSTLDGTTPPAILAVEQFLRDIGQDVGAGDAPSVAHNSSNLSERELEVLRLLAAGQTNQQIADELVISINTVRRHVSNVFDKTGIVNRAQAGVWARNHGLA
jgi:DNA-binding CsgD family transcriptional regulator/pimeloyl-ACP methyl ester carboxylesterase